MLLRIALTQLPNVGTVLARNLVSFSGGVEAVFRQKKSHLLKIPGIGPKIADHILTKSTFDRAEAEVKFVDQNGIKALFFLDQEYPFRLKHYKDAPTLLYYKGSADLNTSRILAVVGTRKPTVYGTTQCQRLIDHLADRDVLIVSGLAYGVDVTAHRRALEIGLDTVGVMGSGFDRVYPAVHRKIARDMIEQGGLLTEFVSGTIPDRENFPMRNRIIAGICDALVVVESDLRGGSMISAEMGNAYHKDVFAIPGRVGDQWSRGCNYLIKSNKAILLDTPGDLSDMMQWTDQVLDCAPQRQLFVELDETARSVYDALDHESSTSIDKLYKITHLSASELASILLNLEFQGLLKALPGKQYLKI